MYEAGTKAERLLSVNHTTKTIHEHHYRHQGIKCNNIKKQYEK